MKPSLSIIVPVYNNERYISFCLESLLLHQNIDKELYEVIVVNDGSTDRSFSIIQSYAQIYSNIFVINQENSGVSVARNRGLEIANGDYVWFVDGDDFIKANCIEAIIDKLDSLVDVYHFNGFAFKDELFYENMIFEEFNGEPQPWFVTYVFSLSFLNNKNIRFERGIRYCEDQLFINDIMLNKPRCISDNCIYYYNRRNEYSVSASNRQEKIKGYFDLLELLEKRLDGLAYPPDNTLHQIESILRMRFLCAMDDMSIITSEQLSRGKVLSQNIASYLSSHKVSEDLRKAFNDYKKLCQHCETPNWKKYLYRWRASYNRKKSLRTAIKHPKRNIKRFINIFLNK